MALQGTGRVFSSGRAETLYVSIPSPVATDSAFPFADGESVTVSIDVGELRVTRAEKPSDGGERRSEPSEF